MSVTTDTDALVATLTYAVNLLRDPDLHRRSKDALDALATRLEACEEREALNLEDATGVRATRLLEARLDKALALLRRIRQWDMLVGGIGADGEHHEATADAPYWRYEIDRCLTEIEGEA